MIGAQQARAAGATVAACLAACSSTPDPCAGATTCVQVDVISSVIETIDQLELDVVYGGVHATITTGAVGDPRDLPLSTAIILDLPGSSLISIDVVAAGKLGGLVLGGNAVSTTVQPGHQAEAIIYLLPVTPCIEGALYCGGTSSIFADTRTLYRCTGNVPIFYARCSSGCIDSSTSDNAECFGSGLCRDGGTYCGGHVVDGDPNTLYVCMNLDATTPTHCPNGCLVRGDGLDACR